MQNFPPAVEEGTVGVDFTVENTRIARVLALVRSPSFRHNLRLVCCFFSRAFVSETADPPISVEPRSIQES